MYFFGNFNIKVREEEQSPSNPISYLDGPASKALRLHYSQPDSRVTNSFPRCVALFVFVRPLIVQVHCSTRKITQTRVRRPVLSGDASSLYRVVRQTDLAEQNVRPSIFLDDRSF